jgi:uroporphyrinogen-III synthase|tara:strand:- start:6478 stop:7275 length:798 start_codon:yes stop_codon:yes gene_type:complete
MSKSTSPLAGKRIVVTRNLEASGRLTKRLKALKADVLELPLIDIKIGADPVVTKEIFAEIGQYEWLIFTSVNGVRGFFEAFFDTFEDIRSLGFLRLAAVGEATAAAIRTWHLQVEMMPEVATAEALGEALKEKELLDNLRILIVTGNRNRGTLVTMLEEERSIVDLYPVYETALADLSNDAKAAEFRSKGADALVFSSSSAVESFGQQASHLKLEKGAKVPALCSFGPQTTATMKAASIPVTVEADSPSLEKMVDALEAHFSKDA